MRQKTILSVPILLSLFFCLYQNIGSAQQNTGSHIPGYGSVKGQVTTSGGDPAAAVTVSIKKLDRHTITDASGNFSFSKVPVGDYVLEISVVGYQTASRELSVKKGEATTALIGLELSASELEHVTVIGSVANKFVTKQSEYIARLPLKNLENPQVYHTVGRIVMDEQLSVERTDIYRNIPGAVPNFSAGGSQGLSLRGFSGTVGMRNGMATSAIVPLNPIILERVEAIKGPSGTLFGSNRNTSFGGVFNYVTKKPYDHFGGEVSLTGGSFNFVRVTADVNAPVSADKKLLFRLNTGFQSAGSFQDQGYNKNFTIAPALRYQLSDRATLDLEAELTRGNYTTTAISISSAALSSLSARNFKELRLPYKTSLINNGVDVSNGINNVQARLTYKISPAWRSETNYLYSEGFYNHLLWTTLNFLTDSTIARAMRNQTPETFGNIEMQQNFIGDFLIGTLRNRVVIGLDYNHNYYELNRAVFTFDTVNLNHATPAMSPQEISERSLAKGFSATTNSADNYSIYISDVLNFTDQLAAMLSVRGDRYSTRGAYSIATGKYAGGYHQNAVSPKFGLVYQVIKDQVSLFANYMNGFANLAPAVQPDGSILKLKPQYANQFEGGVKIDALHHRLNATLNYYRIDVTNSVRQEIRDNQAFSVQDGTQLSRGFEAELIANPLNGLNINAGYAYNKNTYEKATAALQGKTLPASPKHVGNLWASYFLTRGAIKGFGLGLGANYVSDSWFEPTNNFAVPAYTLLSAALYYDHPKYRITIKGNNLLDQKYWNATGMAQKPINFLASIAVKL
ncbi:iron complex outermembrane recepter protein [Arachidicoccus rhizosphaerae]|uniref:Iron complex outermembrane recepter protein n=1 Tax=Arachidicoccus rhizosphaerae TaxID=551991 RepID=A0A1H4CV43_9BACT|nr:TonB-dependent receptor [Arachidicoccus rhizosphaerae]SEA64280.1 iron complex outermembrane recepter protein [Arachidicoccus rhizosphaerae]